MRKWTLIATGLMLTVGCGGTRMEAQEDRGLWNAASSEAKAVTSDIAIGKDRVTIDLATFPLAAIRALKPVEVSAVFDADVNAGIGGRLYRLDVPARQRFAHKNTLCGDENTQWMATYVTGPALRVAFFSGDEMPVFTFEAMQKSTALCGKFIYAR